MEPLKRLAEGVRAGEPEEVRALAAEALAAGVAPSVVLRDGLIAGMSVVGEAFRLREIFLPDVLLAARAMQAGLDLLRPQLAADGVPTAGRVVLGTVRGDLHDIGKNLVGILLGGAGFEVVDLGVDVPPERFVETAVERGAAVIGVSALLTTTMTGMREVVALVRARGLGDRVKVIVGGAPVTEAFAREIGADGWGYDAASAVVRVKQLAGVA
ncbi:MAG: corrinoid protein [Acidobacteria bacterium]|nr:corrinoid protein [Acidobacteriota bacterium]MCU0258624.1 corrinoid protein [Solirubrobacteraceae bacterium]